MYKIVNTDVPDKAVYMKADSLYQLMLKEQGIMAAAALYRPEEDENKFNNLVNAAVNDFAGFSANKWLNPTPTEIHLYTNFNEFFDYIIDVKKSVSVNTAAAAEVDKVVNAGAAVATTAVGPTGEPAPKRIRQQK